MENISAARSMPLFRRILIVLGKAILFLVLAGFLIIVLSLAMNELLNNEQRTAMASGDMSKIQIWLLNIFYCILLGSTLFSLYIVRKLISKQPLSSAGLGLKGWPRELGEGGILGTVLVGIGYLFLVISGLAHSEGWHFLPLTFLGWLVLFLLQPFFEELLFRGYLMSLLGRYFSLPVALIFSSFAFALVHAWNDGFSMMGFITIIIAGFLFGLLFLKTGRLWLPTGLHAAWNFMQGVVFGFPTSGIRTYSITETSTSGPDWLSGGAFGFEGSILAVLLILAAIWWYRESYRQENLSAVMNLSLPSTSKVAIAAEILDDGVE